VERGNIKNKTLRKKTQKPNSSTPQVKVYLKQTMSNNITNNATSRSTTKGGECTIEQHEQQT